MPALVFHVFVLVFKENLWVLWEQLSHIYQCWCHVDRRKELQPYSLKLHKMWDKRSRCAMCPDFECLIPYNFRNVHYPRHSLFLLRIDRKTIAQWQYHTFSFTFILSINKPYMGGETSGEPLQAQGNTLLYAAVMWLEIHANKAGRYGIAKNNAWGTQLHHCTYWTKYQL